MGLPMKIRIRPLFALLACLACAPALALDPTLEHGKRLLDQGDGRAAYELLEPMETERSGEPAFDFLLGLAALDAGQNTRAVFALERVLAVEPGNARARAELARAYLALGENRAARKEFENVRAQPIPEGVATTIDQLLALIERAENRARPSFNGYAELTLGRDSNVNSATDARSIVVPALGPVTLNAGSVETADTFASLGGGGAYRHPFAGGHALTATVNGLVRKNRDASAFDTSTIDGSIGWQLARGKNTTNVAATASTFRRDGESLRDTTGLQAQWQHDYDALRQSTLFLQYLDLKYPDQPVRDARRVVLGAGYAQALRSRTVAFGSAYAGGEFEKADNQPQLGHKLGGIRGGAQVRFTDQWSMLANLSWEKRRYGGSEPLFLQQRIDTQVDAGIGLTYQIDRRWKAGARIAYVRNDSTISVYEYDRQVYSIHARVDF
jgi:tetratricopeptide (TPR) repeat protein